MKAAEDFNAALDDDSILHNHGTLDLDKLQDTVAPAKARFKYRPKGDITA